MVAKTIDEEIKVFLRSVLISAPGVRQENLPREYKQITGEIIPWRKMGFQNLFQLLKALEGEVTRLEFSEKFCDNMVYAVVDNSTYVSKHAAKFAARTSSCIKAKSPEEIIEWKKKKLLLDMPAKPNSINKEIHISDKTFQLSLLPETRNDWCLLRNLAPNQDGFYHLCVKNMSGNGRKDLTVKSSDLLEHFEEYRPQPSVSLVKKKELQRCAYIKFNSYINAFQAWRCKTTSVVKCDKVSVKPCCSQPLPTKHQVIIINLPTGLLMSTIVKSLAKYPGLLAIDPKLQTNSAVVYFTSDEAANRALSLSSLVQKGVEHQVVAKRFYYTNSNQQNSNQQGSNQQGSNQQNSNQTKDQQNTTSVSSSNVNANLIQNTDGVCGFNMDYSQMLRIFSSTSSSKPPTADSLGTTISFLVTYPVDSCRFWGIIWDSKGSHLVEIEKALSNLVASNVCPQPGQRGAGQFAEDSIWYRCWVLESNPETNELNVFWCDYGNTSVITTSVFRFMNDSDWRIPPYAVPFKFYDHECVSKDHTGVERLAGLLIGKPLTARIVKNSTYSQPHIIELADVRCGDGQTDFVRTLLDEGFLKQINNLQNSCVNTQKESTLELTDQRSQESEVFKETALFKFNEDDLVFGMISEVHNPVLIYLQVGPIADLVNVEKMLHEAKNLGVMSFYKGSILMTRTHNKSRRVMVLKESSEQCEVLHVDYGEMEWINKENLFGLKQELCDYPFQARPALLAGVDASKNINKATSYLKRLIKTPMKVNILSESINGKVAVELFSIESLVSYNSKLVSLGIASKTNDMAVHENVDILVKDTQTALASSGLSLNSTVSSCFLSLHEPSNDVQDWVETTNQHELYTPPTPHELISSDIIQSCKDTIRIVGNEVYVGNNLLRVNSNNELNGEDIDLLEEKFYKEKKDLQSVVSRVERLTHDPENTVVDAYKGMQEERRKIKIRLTELRKNISALDAESFSILAQL